MIGFTAGSGEQPRNSARENGGNERKAEVTTHSAERPVRGTDWPIAANAVAPDVCHCPLGEMERGHPIHIADHCPARPCIEIMPWPLHTMKFGREFTVHLMSLRGDTHASIARAVGLSRARVSQIIKMYRDLPSPVLSQDLNAASPILDLPGLTGRELRCIQRANVSTIGDLAEFDDTTMLGWPGFGKRSLNRVRQALRDSGIFERATEIVGASVLLCCTLATTLYDAGLVFLLES
jgi:hypothetical protein